jgi:hypothetical protein
MRTHPLETKEGHVRTPKEMDRVGGTHYLETADGGTSQTRKEIDQARGTHFLETAREGQVRTRKEIDRASGTHSLKTAEGGTSQDTTERNRLRERHSLPGDHRGRDKSGHGKKLTERGALTPWRPQKEEQVRTRKETGQARGTHSLETS